MSAATRSVSEIETWVIDRLSEFLPRNAEVSPDTPLVDTGLDSVEAVGLAADLEDWLGRPVSPNIAWEQPTVADIARALAGLNRGSARTPANDQQPVAAGESHAFARSINPALGELLARLSLDKRFVRGEGAELVDATGARYLDFVAAYGALPFGHNPPAIWDAMTRARDRQEPNFAQPSFLQPAGELAEALLARCPASMKHVTFANSGAEAVEAAIKMCRLATGRLGIVSADGGFHGKTLGALSATGNANYRAGCGAPAGDFESVPFGDVDALRARLAARTDHVAAVILEPIQGEGGVIEPPAGYLAAARELCDEYGALLVFDEVQTGLGRTGTWFGYQHAGVVPDVMTLAKALGGGIMPIGAVVSSSRAWSSDFGRQHSSTFAGGGLACRAALATLELLGDDDSALISRVAELGERMRRRLQSLVARFPTVLAEVRGRGFLLGLRFAVDRQTWPSSVLGLAGENGGLAPLLASYLLNVEGVRVAPTLNGRDVIRIEPPLTATWVQCEAALAAIERAVKVLATGDAGRVLGSIQARAELPPATARIQARPRLRVPPAAAGENRFGFLVHPLDLASYADFDPTLGRLDRPTLERAVGCVHGLTGPAVIGETRIRTAQNRTAYGEFIMVGHTAVELATMSHEDAVAAVREGVELARDRGARVVGLGAFTSIVTQGGRALGDAGVPVTSGNAFTAAAARRALVDELAAREHDGSIAVLGAGGAIGRAMVMQLAATANHLHLVGNPNRSSEYVRRQLTGVLADAAAHIVRSRAHRDDGRLARLIRGRDSCPTTGSSAEDLRAFAASLIDDGSAVSIGQDARSAARAADAVVTATSTTEAVLEPADLRAGAVLCEISRPYALAAAVRRQRPDVRIIDAGVIALPGRPHIGGFGLPHGHAYACMAETMLLALDGDYDQGSIGAELDVAQVAAFERRARHHGFEVRGRGDA